MTPEQILRTYADLAELYERQGQPKHRDWFLVLAADAALSAQQPAEADRLLGRLLTVNPHHFLRPFASFGEALRSPDVQGYVGNLKRNYPPDKAHELLQTEQRKRGGESREDPPHRPVAPPLAQPPREQPEVLFARVRSAPQEEAEAHFAPEPEPPPQPEPPPPPRPAATPPPRAPMPKPRPITRPVRDEAPPEDELILEDEPPRRPKAAPDRKPRRGARATAKPELPPDTNPVLPSFLFFLLLLATVALAAYALLGPLLPEFKP